MGKGKHMNLNQEISTLISKIRQEIADINDELAHAPLGCLYVRKKGDRFYYSEYSRGKVKGITLNESRIYSLARKGYLYNSLNMRRNELNILLSIQSRLQSAKYSRNEDEYLSKFSELDPYLITVPPWQIHWEEGDYVSNSLNPEGLKYRTSRGNLVRSKSERHIANFLERNNIPYRYEAAFHVYTRTLYPDFTILKSDGSTVVWEHFGMLDDPNYEHSAYIKIREYRDMGYKQNRNLICTDESDLLDDEILMGILKRYILD
jgi:hypothetical protein